MEPQCTAPADCLHPVTCCYSYLLLLYSHPSPPGSQVEVERIVLYALHSQASVTTFRTAVLPEALRAELAAAREAQLQEQQQRQRQGGGAGKGGAAAAGGGKSALKDGGGGPGGLALRKSGQQLTDTAVSGEGSEGVWARKWEGHG